ncbi:hypothetical protein [Pseudarthrobacter sp. NamE5]|uniref:hypothetical protein n=1 Tax=Pseudarthrobacter sp. NamE5 TaxID=2576839 RepID=UPI00110B42B9|nr:hypothetical protein [Pseudarthrobacter sp. NamE5]TLM87994.1 hypothetical protein FDW84_00195 [Pseudarthrobacter sp. NamE5]
MTTGTADQLTVPGEPAAAEVETPLSATRPADMGLLLTLDSRMHCRAPMQLVDPGELPVRQPVYVDGTTVLPVSVGAGSEHVETYRCACGFTIDAPVLAEHALAS